MKNRNSRLDTLRTRALEALKAGQGSLDHLPESARQDVAALLEELRIYQAELEIQNQQLIEAQQAGEQQLQRYTALFSNLPLPALVLNDSGVVLENNEAVRQLFGLGRVQFLHHSVFRLLTRRDDPTLASLIARSLNAPATKVRSARVAFRTSQAEEHWFEVHLHPLPPAGPPPHAELQFVALLVDQTPYRQLMQDRLSLQESEGRFRKLFEEASQAAALIEDGQIVEVNGAALDMARVDGLEEFVDLIARVPAAGAHSSPWDLEQAVNDALAWGVATVDWAGRRADGEPCSARVQLTRIEYNGKSLVHAAWTELGPDAAPREPGART